MKRRITWILCLLMTLLFAVPAWAADYDLAAADGQSMEAFRKEIESGVRVFDQAGALNASEITELQAQLKDIENTYGQMMVVVIVENQDVSADMDVYADRLYTDGKLGDGSDRDGVLLVLDLGDEEHRGVHLYAQGGAARYLTDRAIDQIYDEYDGGMIEPLAGGDYDRALLLYADALEALYAQGIRDGQYNYDAETGAVDYYKAPRQVKFWHVIVALLAAGLAGLIPVLNIRNKYSMVTEKRQAKYVNMAYRANAAFAYASVADTLIGTHTVHVPIPRQDSSDHSSGGSGFGGGRSTMHSSGGGGYHSSGGRRF